MITVCGVRGIDRALRLLRPSYVVSLLDPGVTIDHSDAIGAGRHLHIEVYDTLATANRPGFPNERCVERILAFGARWSGHDRMVIHCVAAQSRSPATAAVLLAQKFPDHVERIARLISQKLPQARPNLRLIEAGDKLLGLNGRLFTAIKAMPEPTLRDFENRFATIPFPVSLERR